MELLCNLIELQKSMNQHTTAFPHE